MNSRTHSAHRLSPFELLYGYLPLFNIPVGRRTGIPEVENRIDILRDVRRDAGAALHLTKRHMKEGFERGKKKAHQFAVVLGMCRLNQLEGPSGPMDEG